jgi:hypothetical protein
VKAAIVRWAVTEAISSGASVSVDRDCSTISAMKRAPAMGVP